MEEAGLWLHEREVLGGVLPGRFLPVARWLAATAPPASQPTEPWWAVLAPGSSTSAEPG